MVISVRVSAIGAIILNQSVKLIPKGKIRRKLAVFEKR
jgi:hypothetical protein